MRLRAGLMLLCVALLPALFAGCGSGPSDEASDAVARWAIGQGGKVTIAGGNTELQRIEQLPDKPFAIERLNLNGADVGSKDLRDQDLTGLTSLKYLGLHSTDVTDKTLDTIAGIKTLTELELSNTQITDAGLAKLAELKGLKTLYLYNNTLSKPAITRLKQQLPNCAIYH
ncbi:MAG: leucine-rich repeat domain-containing protein [Planctomycetaceae bacterium]